METLMVCFLVSRAMILVLWVKRRKWKEIMEDFIRMRVKY